MKNRHAEMIKGVAMYGNRWGHYEKELCSPMCGLNNLYYNSIDEIEHKFDLSKAGFRLKGLDIVLRVHKTNEVVYIQTGICEKNKCQYVNIDKTGSLVWGEMAS